MYKEIFYFAALAWCMQSSVQAVVVHPKSMLTPAQVRAPQFRSLMYNPTTGYETSVGRIPGVVQSTKDAQKPGLGLGLDISGKVGAPATEAGATTAEDIATGFVSAITALS